MAMSKLTLSFRVMSWSTSSRRCGTPMDSTWSAPATWYTLPPENYNIVPLHHSQAQWDNRQHPRLYQTFCEFWGTGDLWVTIDRIGFQPPERASHPVLPLHWDMDPTV